MWYAKPSGAYAIESNEGKENIIEAWQVCQALGFSKESFCGMMGNSYAESGWNPWRWQNDKYNVSDGYGLFQYTPASGYLNEYGKIYPEFAPNLSTTSVTTGANASDGIAQLKAIENSGKYFGNETRTARIIGYYADCVNYQTLSNFKTINNIGGATVCWLGYFESPATIDDNVVRNRISYANKVKDIMDAITPTPTPTDVNFIILAKAVKRRKKW